MKKKKVKIRYKRVLIALLILFLIVFSIYYFINLRIKNIYIYENNILEDQEIIDIAGISDYPKVILTYSSKLEKNLEDNIYIKDASVTHKKLTEVHINIVENYPVFYDSNKEVVIYQNKEESTISEVVPTLINYIPDTIYDNFLEKIISIDINVISKISEIKYDPNDVDIERFLLTMKDGNYVYVSLEKFEKINQYEGIYMDIIEKSEKNGIIYLDSGDYFDEFED